MKPLSSLKPKKRYIKVAFDAEEIFSSKDVGDAMMLALHRFLGEFGVAKAAPLFIKEKYAKNVAILKVAHTAVAQVKAALLLITTIKKKPVIPRIITVSGTIKTAASR